MDFARAQKNHVIFFPTKRMSTQEESLALMKNVIRMALASIAYLRDLFEEKNFKSSAIGTVRTMVLRPVDKETKIFSAWLEDLFGALSEGYLRKMCFSVSADPTGLEPIEQYEFVVEYVGEHRTNEVIKQEAKKMMRALIATTEKQEPLPVKRFIAMKAYDKTDEKVTTVNGCGGSSTGENEGKERKEKNVCRPIGVVETPYHKLSVRYFFFFSFNKALISMMGRTSKLI